MGRPILYKENNAPAWATRTAASSASRSASGRCRRAHALLPAREAIADQLIELQTQVVQLRSRDHRPRPAAGRPDRPLAGILQPPTTWSSAATEPDHVLLLGEPASARRCSRAALHDMSARASAVRRRQLRRHPERPGRVGTVRRRARRLHRRRCRRPRGPLRARRRRDPLPRRDRRPAGQLRQACAALQEGEIERLGDHRTRKVNVRLGRRDQRRTCASASRKDVSAPTCTTGSTPIPVVIRHCASARRTSCCSPTAFEKTMAVHGKKAARLHRQGQARAAHPLLAGQHPRACRTWSSAASSLRRAARASRSNTCSPRRPANAHASSASPAKAGSICRPPLDRLRCGAVFNGVLTPKAT